MADLLHGKPVLIVEDKCFIVAGLRAALREAEVDVVGPVGQLSDATIAPQGRS